MRYAFWISRKGQYMVLFMLIKLILVSAIKTKYFWNTYFCRTIANGRKVTSRVTRDTLYNTPNRYDERQYYFEKIDKVNINVFLIPHGGTVKNYLLHIKTQVSQNWTGGRSIFVHGCSVQDKAFTLDSFCRVMLRNFTKRAGRRSIRLV